MMSPFINLHRPKAKSPWKERTPRDASKIKKKKRKKKGEKVSERTRLCGWSIFVDVRAD